MLATIVPIFFRECSLNRSLLFPVLQLFSYYLLPLSPLTLGCRSFYSSIYSSGTFFLAICAYRRESKMKSVLLSFLVGATLDSVFAQGTLLVLYKGAIPGGA